MSANFTLDDEPFLLVVPSGAAIPPGNITEAEWLALKDRVTVVEAGYDLGDLNDVSTTGVADGDAIIYDAASGTFVPGSSGGTIGIVRDSTGTSRTDVANLWALNGLRVDPNNTTPGRANLVPVYGTTPNTIAQGSHQHSQWLDQEFDIAATGTLSGGSRTLATGTVSGLQSDRAYILRGHLLLDLRGEGTGAGYTHLSITIGNVTRTRPRSRTVSGVDREVSWRHGGYGVATNETSVSVSAEIQYDSGDPINVGAGRLFIEVVPYR